MGLLSRLLVILLAGGAPVAAHAETLCDALHAFERTPLTRNASGRLQPRHVDLLWLGPWMDLNNMGYECRHWYDPAGQALCRTLAGHIPQEFRTALPFQIMRCYGYRFPRYVTYKWHAWSAEIRLSDGLVERLRLDVSMSQGGNLRDAIRLVVIPPPDGQQEIPLPSLREPVPPPEQN
jgi:hypothetical protein